jgi:hypothetical protein
MQMLGRPLLLEGEAGVGKTAVANALSKVHDTQLIRLQCYEGLDQSAALYEWNYQRQLLAIQARQGKDAAAVEDAISSANFIANPSAAMSGAGCATNTNNKNCYDVTGDGTPDIIVQLTPAPCIKKVQAVKNSAITDPSDGCIAGAKQNMGLEGSANDNSLCSETLWEITAVATDAVTSANSTVTSGVTVRIAADDAMSPGNICPP